MGHVQPRHPATGVVAQARRQARWVHGVHRLAGGGVAAARLAIGKRRAPLPARPLAPAHVALDLEAAQLDAADVDRLEHQRVARCARAADLAQVFDEVLVAASECCGFDGQTLQAPAHAQLKVLALLGLEVGVGHCAVVAHRVLEEGVDLPRIGRTEARRVVAKHAPLLAGAVQHAELGRGRIARQRHRLRAKARLVGLDAEGVKAHAGRDAPGPAHELVLHIQGRAGLGGVGEALEREGLARGRRHAGLQVLDFGRRVVQAVGDLLHPRPAVAQHLAALQVGLPGALVIGHVAHAVGGGVAVFGDVLARMRVLPAQHGLHIIGKRGVHAPVAFPRRTAALHVGERGGAQHGRGGQRRLGARREQLIVGRLVHMLQREHMALSAAGRQHHLAQQSTASVLLRIGLGAVGIGRIVGAHVVQLAGAGDVATQQPLHRVARLARHRGAHALAVLVAVIAQAHPAADAFVAVEKRRWVCRDEVDQARHAVGAIQRRGGAAHHLDALQQPDVQIVAPEGVGAEDIAARQADAIHHHQHAVTVQPPDVEARVLLTPRGATG